MHMSKEKAKDQSSFLERVSAFIVDKRSGVILVYTILFIFCIFSRSWVGVNNDITVYLPESTETRQGLTVMEDEFVTFGQARVMVANVTYQQAQHIKESIENVDGVTLVSFENSDDHYKQSSALYSIAFDGEVDDPVTLGAMEEVKEIVSRYDAYIDSEIGKDTAAALAKEISTVLFLAIFIILGVLLFTSKTYMEIPVLLITFAVAAVLNMGTHFIYGEISFVSNSIAVILQLALAIDYAIILCHRFTEEREHYEAREATIKALSKAIPEISSSSLTTISGLMALMFMQFQLGFDMGLVLIKALVFSIITVFTLMPGLLMIFSTWMDKTRHRNFVPSIKQWGKVVVKTRFVVPIVFIGVVIVAFLLSSSTSYVFGFTELTTPKQNETQIAEKKIREAFGKTVTLAVIVPTGNYESEELLIKDIKSLDNIDSVMGLGNTEAKDEYVLTDRLTTRQFAELADLDIEVSRLLYSAYAVEEEKYGKVINGLDTYEVPLIDMFDFAYKQKEEGYVNLEDDMEADLNDMNEKLVKVKSLLKGENYSRIIVNANIPEEGEEAYKYLDILHGLGYKYYDEVLIVGQTTSCFDLSTSFAFDNVIITVLSALFVMVILLFTFKSAGIPVLLVLTIQGSIWLNFSFPPLQKTNIYFMSYLVITAIQMGATIDYAIVITSRYMELKKEMDIKDAMIEALNKAFPTIITSGTILASAGLLIGQLSSDYAISSIGTCLGRGTIISLILVMGVLPQTLLFGDTLIEKTAFVIKRPNIVTNQSGTLRVNGRLQGYVSGMIDAEVNGTIKGDLKGYVEAGSLLKVVEAEVEEGDNHEKIPS